MQKYELDEDREDLIKAQNQVIGILFEVVKRLQANNNLDEEYFELVRTDAISEKDMQRLDDILKTRKENTEIVSRLLEQLQ